MVIRPLAMKRDRETVLKISAENRETIRGFGVKRWVCLGLSPGAKPRQEVIWIFYGMETKSFDVYMDLKDFLEKLFGCKVDLVMKDALKPRLREPN